MLLHDRLWHEAKKIMPVELPIGVYIVTEKGEFVYCNRKARKILGFPPEGQIQQTITECYRDPEKREELLKKLEPFQDEADWIEQEKVQFKVGAKDILVQIYCRWIKDSQTGEVIGFMGCLDDITDEERYRELFQKLPAGVYRLDEKDIIVEVNNALVMMLGYDSGNELMGLSALDLYTNIQEGEKIRQNVELDGSIVNAKIELKKKNGESIYALTNSFRINNPDGSYAGREGMLTDITPDERYRKNLDVVPVGFYVVHERDGKEEITHCNKQLALLLEFEDGDSPIGYDVRDFHESLEETHRLKEALYQKDKEGLPLLGFPLNIKTQKGNGILFEVNSRLVHRHDGEIIGRTGIVRDITEETKTKKRAEKLKSNLDELTADIGRVLHVYSATLSSIHLSIDAVIRTYEYNPFDKTQELLPDKAIQVLLDPTREYIDNLEILAKLLDDPNRYPDYESFSKTELKNLIDLMQDLQNSLPQIAFQLPTIREAALKTSQLIREIDTSKISKDTTRQVQKSVSTLLSLCNLVDLHQVKDAIMNMDYVVRSLREYIVSQSKAKEVRTVWKIGMLINRAVTQLNEYVRNKGVNIKFKIENPEVQVEVVERDVVRAMANLLHNAIKYSWKREKGELPWVLITTRMITSPQKKIWIEFENYGVQIPREEIEHDLIFQIAYRGRLSSDRGRMGTGVGLTDARLVARDHGGDVVVESHPASYTPYKDDPYIPYLTTARLILPIYPEKEES
jgi:PAS domain S-box-containing protein